MFVNTLPLPVRKLFHQIRVGELKSFEQVLSKHGQGRGCDVCKPMIGSIMASLWNDHILEKPHQPCRTPTMRSSVTCKKTAPIPSCHVLPVVKLPRQTDCARSGGEKYNLYTKSPAVSVLICSVLVLINCRDLERTGRCRF